MKPPVERSERRPREVGRVKWAAPARTLTALSLLRTIAWLLGGVAAISLAACGSHDDPHPAWVEIDPATVEVPDIPQEFRGLWVASVANIDWPSRRDLDPKAQQAEAIRILDLCLALHLNAVVLQVRPSADALYASRLEPWSEKLKSPSLPPLARGLTRRRRRSGRAAGASAAGAPAAVPEPP